MKKQQGKTEKSLINFYDGMYKKGEDQFWTILPIEERINIITNMDFTGKNVLEIGCGTGDFSAWIASCGAKSVVGIDPSKAAIYSAMKKYNLTNLLFLNADASEMGTSEILRNDFDIVVMVGVLEHVIDPASMITLIEERFLGPTSVLVTSIPNFCNPRGFIWLALKNLFDAPMSLTDKHMIDPVHMKRWAADAGLDFLLMEDVDKSWGCGDDFIKDYRQRLPKVFPDMDKERIHKMLDYLESVIADHECCNGMLEGQGANMVYYFTKGM